MLGVVAQEMPTVEVGIHAGRMRHLVDERFLVEGVLRIVDRAPNAERHRRLLHHIVDQIIRHIVGHLVGEARDERAVDEAHAEARHEAMNERWPGNPHLPCDRHAVRAEPGDQPRHAKGPIVVVFDVLLARPEELDRDIDLFRDQDGLADEFLDGGATPETAAQKRAVDHDLLAAAGQFLPLPAVIGSWVGTQTSTSPLATWAVQVCGSMVACARNGTS